MATKKSTPPQSVAKKISKEEKSIKSLRSLSSIIALGAGLNLLAGLFLIWSMLAYHMGVSALINIILSFAIAGTLYWCSRLLDQRNRRVLTIYASLIFAIWCIILVLRIIDSQPLFELRDLLSLILPAYILFEMYRFKQNGILT